MILTMIILIITCTGIEVKSDVGFFILDLSRKCTVLGTENVSAEEGISKYFHVLNVWIKGFISWQLDSI